MVSGEGWHSQHMEHWGVLPFEAFEGTLNLFVGDAAVAGITAQEGKITVGGGVQFFWWPGTLQGVDVVVTWNVGCAPGVVELVAAVRLRDLPLCDGDVVEVSV